MDEDMLNDLKQFIAATVTQVVTQAEVALVSQLDDLEHRMAALEQRVDNLSRKLDTISEAVHENLSDHEARLTRLEQQTV